MGSCGNFLSGVVKNLLFIFNFIIFICAIILIVYGAIMLNDEDVGFDDFDNLSVSELAIALGVLIGLVSFFGCFGAFKGSSCLLTTYASILCVLLIIQVVLGIVAFVAIKDGDDGDGFDKKVFDYVKEWFIKAKTNTDAKNAFNKMQRNWDCCGVIKFTDWNLNGQVVPGSCCDKDDNQSCTSPNELLIILQRDGCAVVFKEKIKDNAKIIGGVAIGFAIIELVCAIFACCIRNRN